MRNSVKVLVGVVSSCFILNCYAIQVDVKTSSKQVSALGFTVNGQKHGGPGSSYSASKMPVGSYSFGVRVKNADVGCPVSGQSSVMIKKNTVAILTVHGNKCTAQIHSGK